MKIMLLLASFLLLSASHVSALTCKKCNEPDSRDSQDNKIAEELKGICVWSGTEDCPAAGETSGICMVASRKGAKEGDFKYAGCMPADVVSDSMPKVQAITEAGGWKEEFGVGTYSFLCATDSCNTKEAFKAATLQNVIDVGCWEGIVGFGVAPKCIVSDAEAANEYKEIKFMKDGNEWECEKAGRTDDGGSKAICDSTESTTAGCAWNKEKGEYKCMLTETAAVGKTKADCDAFTSDHDCKNSAEAAQCNVGAAGTLSAEQCRTRHNFAMEKARSSAEPETMCMSPSNDETRDTECVFVAANCKWKAEGACNINAANQAKKDAWEGKFGAAKPLCDKRIPNKLFEKKDGVSTAVDGGKCFANSKDRSDDECFSNYETKGACGAEMETDHNMATRSCQATYTCQPDSANGSQKTVDECKADTMSENGQYSHDAQNCKTAGCVWKEKNSSTVCTDVIEGNCNGDCGWRGAAKKKCAWMKKLSLDIFDDKNAPMCTLGGDLCKWGAPPMDGVPKDGSDEFKMINVVDQGGRAIGHDAIPPLFTRVKKSGKCAMGLAYKKSTGAFFVAGKDGAGMVKNNCKNKRSASFNMLKGEHLNISDKGLDATCEAGVVFGAKALANMTIGTFIKRVEEGRFASLMETKYKKALYIVHTFKPTCAAKGVKIKDEERDTFAANEPSTDAGWTKAGCEGTSGNTYYAPIKCVFFGDAPLGANGVAEMYGAGGCTCDSNNCNNGFAVQKVLGELAAKVLGLLEEDFSTLKTKANAVKAGLVANDRLDLNVVANLTDKEVDDLFTAISGDVSMTKDDIKMFRKDLKATHVKKAAFIAKTPEKTRKVKAKAGEPAKANAIVADLYDDEGNVNIDVVATLTDEQMKNVAAVLADITEADLKDAKTSAGAFTEEEAGEEETPIKKVAGQDTGDKSGGAESGAAALGVALAAGLAGLSLAL